MLRSIRNVCSPRYEVNVPEGLFDASIVGNVLSLGVNPVHIVGLALHIHSEVGILVCKV